MYSCNLLFGVKYFMNRIETLRKYVDETLLNMADVKERRAAYVHLYGVTQACALIALKHEFGIT